MTQNQAVDSLQDLLAAPPVTGRGRVDPDAAIAFALATDDPNDACRTGAAVAPMYGCTLIRLASGGPWTGQPSAVTGARASVHGAHDVVFSRPIRPGETVAYTSAPYNLRRTPAGVLTTQRISVHALDGEPIARHLWSNLFVGATASADAGPEIPDHTFPEPARSRPRGSYDFPISVDQAFRFAGVSGDHNLHAIDGQAARAEGFADRILQGVCTMSMAAAAVVRLFADGDPARLARFACRFAAPVFARSVLQVMAFDAGRTDNGSRLVAIEARAAGQTALKHGLAEIRPD